MEIYFAGTDGDGDKCSSPCRALFHTKNFVADFIRLNLNSIHKNDKFAY